MNNHLQKILDFIQQAEHLSAEEKAALSKSVKDTDSDLSIAAFKLERTEKVKRTTAILLEETIEELENKRKAVEVQNKELEIESCLERVRTVAMSMNKPDDMLHVCRTIAEQLQHLNVKEIRNVQTAIFYEDKGTYMNYEYYVKHNKTFITETSYTNHQIHEAFAEKMLKGSGAFYITHIKGDEIKDWVAYQKTTNVFIDTFLETASSLNYYWFSLGPVALGISTYHPLTEENIILFKRFLKVFELAYRRYLDIELAIMQAKEARIETALERVRAVAMAMRKPDELASIGETLFTELKSLEFTDLRNTEIIINNDEKETILSYYCDYGASGTIEIDYKAHPIIKSWAEQLRKSDDAFAEIIIPENEIEAWRKYREEIGYLPDPKLNAASSVYYYSYSIGLGALSISSFKPVVKEHVKILERFRNVFNLSYQRYTDIALAEAQAKEAQIELALERVRARTMAMQHSEELAEAAVLLFQQVRTLGIQSYSSGFTVWKNNDNELVSWMCNADGSINPPFRMPVAEIEWHRQQYESWKKKEDYIIHDFTGKEMQDHYAYLRSFPLLNEAFKTSEAAGVPTPVRQVHNAFNFSHGNLLFITLQPVPEAHDIFKRFAKVFEQTYTRFLDLQKAEAQAREAQIEASLERVRSRSMAMHKSDELKEAGELLWNELGKLGIQSLSSGYVLVDADEKIGWTYAPNPATGKIAEPLGILYTDTKEMLAVLSGWKKQKPLCVIEMDEQETIAHQTFVAERAFNLDGTISTWITAEQLIALSPKRLFLHNFNFKQGYLMIVGGSKLTDDQIELMLRFTKVFQQTYTRFLDLQKAEAQTRESQIELSLERVRAKTMAMHNSLDVAESVSTLFDEVTKLGIATIRCGIGIMHDAAQMELWTAKPNEKGKADLVIGHMDMTMHPLLQGGYNGWKNKEKFYSYELKGDDLINYYTIINNHPDYPVKYDLSSLPATMIHSEFYFPEGTLYSFSLEELSAESKKIFSRFAGVFGQTYRRYLDLQKAEAQAREARIEASLERVRSKAMAMHSSEDLTDTIIAFYRELESLSVTPRRCGVGLINKETHIAEISSMNTTEQGDSIAVIGNLELKVHPILKGIYDNWLLQKDYYPVLRGREIKEYYQILTPQIDYPDYPHDVVQYGYFFFFAEGGVYAWTEKQMTENELKIYKRFTSVLTLTYKRYKDLKQAETQAREANIEASLERVRSRTMAMHNSQDVADSVLTLFDEVTKLGIEAIRCGIGIGHDGGQMELWTAKINSDGKADLVIGYMDMTMHPLLQGGYNRWKNKEKSYSYELKGDDLINYYSIINNHPDYPVKYDLASLPSRIIHDEFYFPEGSLFAFSVKELPAEAKKIFSRFAAVFGQTYRRYLDLQKAEAQAREAQIEASLERVRSRTMAMFKSDELAETAEVVFEQIAKLGETPDRISIGVMDETAWVTDVWATDQAGSQINVHFKASMDERTTIHKLYEAWKEEKKTFVVDLHGDELNDWIDFVRNGLGMPIKDEYFHGRRLHNVAFFSQGWINLTTLEPLPVETFQVLERFASVFNLTYTRFLDLQKAEAQAREAQIETGLERVRSRSLAMHNTSELQEVIQTVHKELLNLNIAINGGSFIAINSDIETALRCWGAGGTADTTEEVHLPLYEKPFCTNLINRIKKGPGFFTEEYTQQEKNEFFTFLLKHEPWSKLDDKEKKEILTSPGGYTRSCCVSQHTSIFIINHFGEKFSDPDNEILKRFAKVFEQTYTRFLDLQKAEAQSREATIEAALEKVRGRAMAMHNSNDLSSTASTVFTELRKLGINPIRCGVGLLNKESRLAQLYSASSSNEGDTLSLVGWVMLSGHPVMENIYDSWAKNEDYYPELIGEQLKSYYELLLAGLSVSVPDWKSGEKQFGHFIPCFIGCLYAWSDHHYSDAEIKILKRFASIIDLTFRRYMELKKSEASAREAVKQAALDRVRADIASMRTIGDLDRITPLIWNELTVLGIPFVRCGVFIMDELEKQIHTFLSTPEGKAIVAFHLPFDTTGNFGEIVHNWQQRKMYINHWDEKDFISLADTLVQQGAIASRGQYMNNMPHEGIYLHFLPFLQGMLYVGNTNRLSEDEISLIQSVADAFSTAYARYEDFNKLEAAKQQVEKTLVDLKQAQTQLIQSEKMASLGELTAGIAHEIQNPLNFVNNFSEVNTELIEELKDEIDKGNIEEVKAIANDIKDNEQKINHHGKRADAIVKGMLQHSRSSIGVKEPTDINILTDEYLRLCYHGLRAKDKSFNATIKTDFDKTIGKINITPQDIGRVILNLLTNAFYAVNEKKKHQPKGYEPKVSIKTKKSENQVAISVSDNGNGIPQKILDKIFQPFFTTKPTGQGTGLGLSLSYDIIKAHGGEIKVETSEKGSSFIIQLSTETI